VVRDAEWSGVAVIKALGALILKRKCFNTVTSAAEWSGVTVIKALGALILKRKCFKLVSHCRHTRRRAAQLCACATPPVVLPGTHLPVVVVGVDGWAFGDGVSTISPVVRPLSRRRERTFNAHLLSTRQRSNTKHSATWLLFTGGCIDAVGVAGRCAGDVFCLRIGSQ